MCTNLKQLQGVPSLSIVRVRVGLRLRARVKV